MNFVHDLSNLGSVSFLQSFETESSRDCCVMGQNHIPSILENLSFTSLIKSFTAVKHKVSSLQRMTSEPKVQE